MRPAILKLPPCSHPAVLRWEYLLYFSGQTSLETPICCNNESLFACRNLGRVPESFSPPWVWDSSQVRSIILKSGGNWQKCDISWRPVHKTVLSTYRHCNLWMLTYQVFLLKENIMDWHRTLNDIQMNAINCLLFGSYMNVHEQKINMLSTMSCHSFVFASCRWVPQVLFWQWRVPQRDQSDF